MARRFAVAGALFLLSLLNAVGYDLIYFNCVAQNVHKGRQRGCFKSLIIRLYEMTSSLLQYAFFTHIRERPGSNRGSCELFRYDSLDPVPFQHVISIQNTTSLLGYRLRNAQVSLDTWKMRQKHSLNSCIEYIMQWHWFHVLLGAVTFRVLEWGVCWSKLNFPVAYSAHVHVLQISLMKDSIGRWQSSTIYISEECNFVLQEQGVLNGTISSFGKRIHLQELQDSTSYKCSKLQGTWLVINDHPRAFWIYPEVEGDWYWAWSCWGAEILTTAP